MLRWITAGESHGPALVALLEGMVAGVEVTSDDIAAQLARRRLGYGRGARMKFEADKVTLVGGVRHGRTMGGPVAIEIANTEWPKWDTVMSADPVDEAELAELARNAPLTRPRPGHADYSGMLKYGFDDARPVLERASARETAARVAAGTVARHFLRQALGVEVISHVVSIGAAADTPGFAPAAADLDAHRREPRARVRQGRRGRDDRRDRGRQEGRRHPRRCGRGDRRRAARRASARSSAATAGSIRDSPARSWASRRSRVSRWATGSRPRAAAAAWPTTR